MNAPLPIRAKLIAAAGSLLVPFGFALFHQMAGHGNGDILFRMGCFIFGVSLAFWGVFRNAQHQLLWGWGLAFTGPMLITFLLLGFVPGSEVLWVSASAVGAFIGGYFLLLDADVKDYRRRLKAEHCA